MPRAGVWARGALLVWLGLVTVLGALAMPWQGFTAMVLSPDGRCFATGGREGEVLWWETSTGELIHRWVQPNAGPVVGLAFDAKGTRLGIALLSGLVLTAAPDLAELLPGVRGDWPSMGTAKESWVASNPLGTSLRITAGRLWAEGSPDGQIRVGAVGSDQARAQWSAHPAAVTGLALASDGSFLLSCSYDGGLSRWDPGTGALLGTLQSPHP